MIDIKLIRENKEAVIENIKKKYQDEKIPLVQEIYDLDKKSRALKSKGDSLRKNRNELSSQIGVLMCEQKKNEAEKIKKRVTAINKELESLEKKEIEINNQLKERMMVIPNLIDNTVPLGKDDSENIELRKYGDPLVPDYEIPYHSDIMAYFNGIDKESAGKTSGNGFYFLLGDIARLHSAMLSYARDFMIDKGFTYCIPPFMIRGDVVNGVMSFKEMDEMMYKLEGEDIYLIGTSEHSMIGKFKDQIIKEEELPITLTSYSPCFRKEVGAHGLEERGVYRVHQFEKQEMIVICKQQDVCNWFNQILQCTIDFFVSLNIPIRTLECCSGDLANLKAKSVDIEAWSPRQQKYFEVGSCSNLLDAQSRRLGIRGKDENGTYYLSTLNSTVVASPRGLIALLENNIDRAGNLNIPVSLQPYMGGKTKLTKI